MQNKTPQGNDMPDTTPDHELEKYGVWVKAEPQDIIEEPETEHRMLGSEDAVDELAVDEEEDFLGSVDKDLIETIPPLPSMDSEADDLSFSLDDEETASGDGLLSMEDMDEAEPASPDGLDSGVISDSVIEIPLDDLDSFDLPEDEPARPAAAAKPSPKPSAADADGLETTEISLDDFGFSDEEPAAAPGKPAAAASMDESSAVDLSEFGLGDEDLTPEAESAEEGDFESLDIDLQFDDTIPAPAESSQEEEETFSLDEVEDIGLEAPAEEPAPQSAPEFPMDAGSMEDVTDIFTTSAPAPRPEAASRGGGVEGGVDSFIDDETEGSDSILPELELEDVSLDAHPRAAKAFNDLDAVERDLAGTASRASADAVSADMLKTIALELSSIKDELVSLRSQLSEIKRGEAREAAEPEAAEEAQAETAAGGFFDDEEDDTIALTGDELNNILNTADFTEETAQLAEEELEPAAMAPASAEADSAELDAMELVTEDSLAAGEEALLPEDGSYELPELESIGDASGGVTQPDAGIILESMPDDIIPVTEAPEDTSYLEEDRDFSLDEPILEESPLVEPDLDELIVEGIEGISDESDGLSIMEPDTEGELDDLVLSIEAPEALDQLETESETVLEEIEGELDESGLEELPADEDMAELELHAEEAGPQADADDLAHLDSSVIKPATPVSVHPDEISMSLDDSLFVEHDRPLEFSSPSGIVMPDFNQMAPMAQDDFETEVLEEPELEAEELSPEPLELVEAETVGEPEPAFTAPAPEPAAKPAPAIEPAPVPDKLKRDVKSVLLYLDQLLASLPEEKIEEFASSQYYDTYKKLFDELGLL